MILSFGSVIISILAFVFALGLIIIIHEGGHFFFARRANILCREYAFGMGPLLWKKKKGETLYSIRALPIGGFCAIAGEEVEDDPVFESTPEKEKYRVMPEWAPAIDDAEEEGWDEEEERHSELPVWQEEEEEEGWDEEK